MTAGKQMAALLGAATATIAVACSGGAVPDQTPQRVAPETVTVTRTPTTQDIEATTEPSPPAPSVTERTTTAYVSPDQATVAQFIRGVFRDRLGRDPDQAEMREHGQWFLDEHRKGGDTEARFLERFERLYANELRLIEDRSSNEGGEVQDGADTLSCMSDPDAPHCQDD